jgi:hypothetical protein
MIYLILGQVFFYSLLIEVRVLCYLPSRRNLFHHATVFNFVSAKMAAARWTVDNLSATISPGTCTAGLGFSITKEYVGQITLLYDPPL